MSRLCALVLAACSRKEALAAEFSDDIENALCYYKEEKDVNLDEQYIKSGANTSIVVTWNDKEYKDKDRFQYFATLLGDEITDYYSVSDWNDAVLSFWVYNPTDYEIEFNPIWSHDGAKLKLKSDPRTVKIAAPNAWTEIKYSLRYFGMTENFYYNEQLYLTRKDANAYWGIGDAEDSQKMINQNWWTCRWGGRKDVGKIYRYTFYIDDFDIRDYDEQKDSDLNNEYRGFWNEPLEQGDELTLVVSDNDGKTFTFEYKIVSEEGAFGVALIGKEWGKDYYGYFFFNKGGYVEDYAGVTVTAQDNGFMKVDFDLTAVDCITGDQKPEKVESLYVRLDYNDANFIIRLAE